MKLVFKKNNQEEITVLQSDDGGERAFIYTDMIKALLKDSGLEEPVLEGAFSDEEKRSITNMVNEINRETKEAMNASTGAEKAEENGSGAESVS